MKAVSVLASLLDQNYERNNLIEIISLSYTFQNAAFGGGTKGFGDRKTDFCLSKNQFFCPQKTIPRHVAKRSDGVFKKCKVESL